MQNSFANLIRSQGIELNSCITRVQREIQSSIHFSPHALILSVNGTEKREAEFKTFWFLYHMHILAASDKISAQGEDWYLHRNSKGTTNRFIDRFINLRNLRDSSWKVFHNNKNIWKSWTIQLFSTDAAMPKVVRCVLWYGCHHSSLLKERWNLLPYLRVLCGCIATEMLGPKAYQL